QSVDQEACDHGPPCPVQVYQRRAGATRRRCTDFQFESLVHALAASRIAEAGVRVIVSVRALLHSRRLKPLASKNDRMRGLSQRSTSSSTGTRTLSASSL